MATAHSRTARRRWRTPPAGPLLLQHARSGFGEGRDALGAALLGERVPALPGELAVGRRLFPDLGQRDQGKAAESKLTAATAFHCTGSSRASTMVLRFHAGVD